MEARCGMTYICECHMCTSDCQTLKSQGLTGNIPKHLKNIGSFKKDIKNYQFPTKILATMHKIITKTVTSQKT